MHNEAETFDQLCTRLAYYLMRDIARGTRAEDIAHKIASQTLKWNIDQEKLNVKKPTTEDEELSHEDLCRLSQVFNAHNLLSLSQDQKINTWLGKLIASAYVTKNANV